MYKKFEEFMNKYLMPIANRMDQQDHLSAIKKSMVAMTPLLIIGSFCLIPDALPNMIGEDNPISQWIMNNSEIISFPYSIGMGLMGLYVAIVMAYHLGVSRGVDIPGSISMSLIGFFMLTIEFTEDGGIDTTYLGTKGLFISMFGTILAVELFRWCKEKNFTIKMPESVPDFVSSSFEMIPISVIIVGVFLAIRVLCLNVFHVMPPMIFTNILAPLVGSMDNPLSFMFLQMLSCLLFFFGIHPIVLSPITSPISTQFLAENIDNFKAGLPVEHFYTGGMISAFGNFTGTGVTFGLVFWCLFSKSKAQKQIGRVALLPALFGINEPILFGAPIVLNPIFFIPYVFGGAILGSLGAWAMSFGWIDMPVFNPPYVGVFLEGFLVNLDWRTIIVNGIQMIGSVLLWYPFFKIYEKQELQKEHEISAEEVLVTD